MRSINTVIDDGYADLPRTSCDLPPLFGVDRFEVPSVVQFLRETCLSLEFADLFVKNQEAVVGDPIVDRITNLVSFSFWHLNQQRLYFSVKSDNVVSVIGISLFEIFCEGIDGVVLILKKEEQPIGDRRRNTRFTNDGWEFSLFATDGCDDTWVIG